MNVVVLLVDPKEKILHCEENPEATLKTISPRLDPGRIATEVLPRPTKGPMTQAENRSMYESLGSAHADVAIENDCRPTSGTAFVRNLVRAAWEEAIYRTKFEIDKDLYADRYQYGFYRDVEQTYTESNRNAQSYHILIQ